MRKVLLILTLALALPLCNFAASIQIYNTGVDSSGNALAIGSVDPHYADTNPANTVYVQYLGYAWLLPTSTVQWIAPDTSNGQSYSGGNYALDYRTSIDLTGFDPASVSIIGGWATDNQGTNILVNGHATGFGSPSYSSLAPFTLSGSSGFFTSGINTIDFQWNNQGGPGAVMVAFTSATANAAGNAPEPASFVLFGAGLAGFAALRRRRQRA
jgi:hypothetical protein